jgi:glycine/sarcosine N-methyltransferase
VTDADAVRRAYDDLAADYERIYPDWRASSRRQGQALHRVLAAELATRHPLRVLDCAAGIGTQLLGLAGLGSRCAGTDLSVAALLRARDEALVQGLPAAAVAGLAAADMRRLPFADTSFDAVVCADNSLPHLLTGGDVRAALREMLRVVVPGGAVLVSTRDYDEIRRTRQEATPVTVLRRDGEVSVTFQVWTWHDDGERYDFDHFVLRRDETGDEEAARWHTRHRRATYWALTRDQLSALAEEAGLVGVRWLQPEQSGFFQPLLVARRRRRDPR